MLMMAIALLSPFIALAVFAAWNYYRRPPRPSGGRA